jgi:hypothetical protein
MTEHRGIIGRLRGETLSPECGGVNDQRLRSVRLQADLASVRLKPDTTYKML